MVLEVHVLLQVTARFSEKNLAAQKMGEMGKNRVFKIY